MFGPPPREAFPPIAAPVPPAMNAQLSGMAAIKLPPIGLGLLMEQWARHNMEGQRHLMAAPRDRWDGNGGLWLVQTRDDGPAEVIVLAFEKNSAQANRARVEIERKRDRLSQVKRYHSDSESTMKGLTPNSEPFAQMQERLEAYAEEIPRINKEIDELQVTADSMVRTEWLFPKDLKGFEFEVLEVVS